ncbi:hypothetical protein FHG87_013466 [Trinorchestia longiramus]|nr:hypothetical protein FHG87_013466 [Trinorchestia longiramus]
MYRVLKIDMGKKPYKMVKRHELTENHERMRAERSRHILNEVLKDSAQSHGSNVTQTIFHKKRGMAIKKPRPQFFALFYLIHFGDKGLSYYPSHVSRVPQSKTAKGMGSNSTRTDTCRLRCICK